MHQHSAACNHHQPSNHSQTKQTQLAIALLLIAGFAIAELLVGLTSSSLALVAEAGHMASDSFALALALLATWIAQLPKRHQANEVLAGSSMSGSPPEAQPQTAWETWAALVNGLGLIAIGGWIAWEAIQRLQTPPETIASLPMLITASIGLAVNSVNIALLHRGSNHDLNLRGAFLHVLADALSCIGVIIAAIAVAVFHWLWVDGAISLFVAALILLGSSALVIQSARRLRDGITIQQSDEIVDVT